MKIIHCSDLHLDAKMNTHLSQAKAAKRKKEILLTFDRLVDYAAANDVRAIIIAGDMFDTPRVSATTKDRIVSLIKASPSIDFFYLSGNHDEVNLINAIDPKPENLKVFGSAWQSYKCGDVVITGVNLESSSPVVFDLLSLDPADTNIVVLHGQKAERGSKDAKDVISFSQLRGKGIDYLALGHYHTFEQGELDKRGKWCYSGCLEGRGFDECGEKGFVLLDVDGGQIKSTFVPFAQRRLVEVEVDISGLSDFYDVERKVLKATEDVPETDIVRAVLVGKYELALNKDIPMLEAKLSSRFFAASVKDKSALKINASDYANDMSLRGEFIREVLASKLTESEKEQVIITGLKVLSGEAIE